MFRLTLGKKLFVALALLLSFSLVLFVGLSRLALHQGIGQYVAEIELSRLDWMVVNLQEAYAKDKGWQAFKSGDEAWHAALTPSREFFRSRMRARNAESGDSNDGGPNAGAPPFGPFMPPPFGEGGESGGRSDGRPEHFGGPGGPGERIDERLALIDTNGMLIAGSTRALRSSARAPLLQGVRTVGYLALAPLDGIRTNADRTFAFKQLTFILVAGLVGLLVALFLSGWLARRWLAPVERLVLGAKALAEGDLGHVVETRGSDEFATLTTTFNHMSQKLASVEESRQRWLSDAAHELRTPVAAMRAEIEALQDGVRVFDSNVAQRLHGQVMRLGKLIADLRLVSEDTYAISLDTGEVRPLKLLIESVDAMSTRYEQADIRILGLEQIAMLDHDSECRIQGDEGRISQVYSNLLENSLKYTDAHGVLALSASIVRDDSKKERSIVIVFDDSAPQPTSADLGRVFDRFYRAESSRARATGGSGLGLSICRAIVAAHGGTIVATESPLGGLRVTLVFPIKEAP